MTTARPLRTDKSPVSGIIVDDDPAVVLLLGHMLRHTGFVIAGNACNGEEAIVLAHETKPDFILMDLGMPVMDGITAIRRIMAECPTPIIVLTIHDSKEAKAAAQDAGAVGYFVKPLTMNEIKTEIQRGMTVFKNTRP